MPYPDSRILNVVIDDTPNGSSVITYSQPMPTLASGATHRIVTATSDSSLATSLTVNGVARAFQMSVVSSGTTRACAMHLLSAAECSGTPVISIGGMQFGRVSFIDINLGQVGARVRVGYYFGSGSGCTYKVPNVGSSGMAFTIFKPRGNTYGGWTTIPSDMTYLYGSGNEDSIGFQPFTDSSPRSLTFSRASGSDSIAMVTFSVAGASSDDTLIGADLLADAPDVTATGVSTDGFWAYWNTYTATATDSEPRLGVWHKFLVGAGTNTFRHSTDFASDTYMYVYSGPANATSFSALTFLASDDDSAGGSKPLVSVTTTATTWLYVLSTYYNNTQSSSPQAVVWSTVSASQQISLLGSGEFSPEVPLGVGIPIDITFDGFGNMIPPFAKPRTSEGVRILVPAGDKLLKRIEATKTYKPYMPLLTLNGRSQYTGPGVKKIQPTITPKEGGGGGGGGGYDKDDGQAWPRGSKGPS